MAERQEHAMKRHRALNMGRFAVQMNVSNYGDVLMAERGALPHEKIRRASVQGIVDTGATHLVLPKDVAVKLGLQETGAATVRYADQRPAKRKMVEQAYVELLGRHGTFKAIVEPRRHDALIGAIVMEDLDLVVDCVAQKLRPRDPKGVLAVLE